MTGDDHAAHATFPMEFIRSRGSPVTGRNREKSERIHDALCDLQLAIDGTAAQLARPDQFEHLQQTAAALARAGSIFLRKTVLGDRNVRATRLLDDDVCRSLDLAFSRLRRIPADRRQLTIDWNFLGGRFQLEKLDEETLATQAVREVVIAPLRLELSVEWPLPGTAGWTRTPTRNAPWRVRPEELFDTESHELGCDAWLGQQLVMFDRRGITLKDAMRTIANYEGAHAANVSRLQRTETERDTDPSRNPELHILNNIKICGLKFNHIVVIEAALYLYRKLVGHAGIDSPKGEINIPTLCLLRESTEDIFAAAQNVLVYDGGVIPSFGEEPCTISHRIRPVR